jgi:hypothetical protein
MARKALRGEGKLRRLLFFLRGHSDTDNIVPVIWFLFDDDASAIVDIVYYHLDFPYLAHPYITALQSRFGNRLKISWIGNFLGLGYDDLFEREEISSAQAERLRESLSLDWDVFDHVFKTKLPRDRSLLGIIRHRRSQSRRRAPILSFNNLVAATSHITAYSPYIVQAVRQACIAWVIGEGPPPCLAVFGFQRGKSLLGLFDALRSVGVEKIVRLPNSPIINVNILRKPSCVVPNEVESELDFTGFDAISYTDRYYPESLRQLFAEMGWGDPLVGKLAVLGAIRYCPEWLAVRPRPPAFLSPNHDNRIKLAFFLSRAKTNTDWQEVSRTLRILDSFPRFHVIVQPHPRDHDVIDIVGRQAEVRADVPSPSLIDWADVVMLWGSSIGLEALLQDKTLLCPTYLNANRNVYEMFGGGWMLRCRDDLVLALAKIQRDPDARAYQQRDVDRLIHEIVFAGDSKPVPARYLEFLRLNERSPN